MFCNVLIKRLAFPLHKPQSPVSDTSRMEGKLTEAVTKGLVRSRDDLDASDKTCSILGSDLQLTAMMKSAWEGKEDEVRLLLDASAAVDAADSEKGGTAFMCAAGGGHMQVMDLLLEKGANPNHLNKTRGSALLWASFAGNNAVVSKLVAIPGFQLNNANDGGWTALMFAAKSGHAEVVATLCKGGADAEMKNNDGETAKDLVEKHKPDNADAILAVLAKP